MSRRPDPTRWLVFVAAAVVGSVFFVDWCNFLFDCGCRSLWNGMAEACNIHAASGPHCPWCEHPLAGGGTAFSLSLGASWLVVFRAPSVGPLGRLLSGCAAFFAGSGAAALAQGYLWGYWRG